MMVFATQSPADALKSDIAHSILEQVATQVMLPTPKGARRDYVDGFSLTDAEYQLIREEFSPESRKFLVKQGHARVVVELRSDERRVGKECVSRCRFRGSV